MFLSREINIKPCQNCTESYIYIRFGIYVIQTETCDNATALPLQWEFWSRDSDVLLIFSILSIKNEKLLNSNNKRSKPPLGYRRFQIGCVFSEQDLFKTKIIIPNLIKNIVFGIVLTQFYVNISRQELRIELFQVSANS